MQVGVIESLKNIFTNGSGKCKRIKEPKWADFFSSCTTLQSHSIDFFFNLREKGKATENENINDSFIT